MCKQFLTLVAVVLGSVGVVAEAAEKKTEARVQIGPGGEQQSMADKNPADLAGDLERLGLDGLLRKHFGMDGLKIPSGSGGASGGTGRAEARAITSGNGRGRAVAKAQASGSGDGSAASRAPGKTGGDRSATAEAESGRGRPRTKVSTRGAGTKAEGSAESDQGRSRRRSVDGQDQPEEK